MKHFVKSLGATIVIVSISLLLLLLVNIGFHLNNMHNIKKIIQNQTGENTVDWLVVAEGLSEYRKSSYAYLSANQVANLLFYTWDPSVAGWEYEPLLGFKEKARTSQYVNVTKDGIRTNANQEFKLEQLQQSIWVFGGSTTFGYGVADNETIPAYLEKIIGGTKVINLGRGYYYSRQENIYLVNLLAAGFRPKKVIFIDGINERCNLGIYQTQLSRLFEKAQSRYSWEYMELVKPFFVWANKSDVVIDRGEINKAMSVDKCENYGKSQPLNAVLDTILIERQAICSAFNITCNTYLQPFAGVHGNHFDRSSLSDETKEILKRRYKLLAPTFTKNGAISLTSSLDDVQGHAFVDNVHYNRRANEAIASAIFRTFPALH